MRRRCSLCGGKLNGNICTECGLDNSKNDDQYVTLGNSGHEESLTHVHTEEEKPYEGKTMTRENVRKAKNADKNAKKADAKKGVSRKPEVQLYSIFRTTGEPPGKKEKEVWKVSGRLCDHCRICRRAWWNDHS